MSLKKLLISALCAACALSLLAPAAYAHGCHGRGVRAQQVQRAACSVEGCTLTGWHYHDNTLYCGHTHGHGLCDGSCAPLCPVEGCTLAGRHVHNGVTYCGANHAAGYCAGNCPYTPAAGSTGTWGGCHGSGRHCGR